MSQQPRPVRSTLFLIVLVALPLFVGFAGGLFTSSSIDSWYVELTKPEWNPPNWIFPVVWTTLYILMGFASWLVWRRAGFAAVRFTFGLYFVHLGLNLLWSILFFGLQNPPAALIEIFILLGSIVLTAVLFARISRLAGLLFVPYIAWVSFAAFLNWTIVALNG